MDTKNKVSTCKLSCEEFFGEYYQYIIDKNESVDFSKLFDYVKAKAENSKYLWECKRLAYIDIFMEIFNKVDKFDEESINRYISINHKELKDIDEYYLYIIKSMEYDKLLFLKRDEYYNGKSISRKNMPLKVKLHKDFQNRFIDNEFTRDIDYGLEEFI